MADIIERLVEALGEDRVLRGTALAHVNMGYPIARPVHAKALVRPRSTREVSDLLRLCHEAGQPVVPYGGLTNLVQGTVTGEEEIALSLERMNRVEEVDPVSRTMTVQAGVTLREVQDAAARENLMVALDFGMRDYCTIGGNVATNAGGGRVLRYGMTREQVLGLEVVLADGTILPAMNRMIKNNTGYDLKHLFIGSEGTLGVITRIVLRLREPPAGFATALVGVDNFDRVVGLLKMAERALSGGLTSFEVMWEHYYQAILSALAAEPPLPPGYTYYILLEAPVAEGEPNQARFEQLIHQAEAQGIVAASVIAHSDEAREAVWAVRYGSEQLDYRYTPIFNFDVSLPIREAETYVNMVRDSLIDRLGQVECWVFGHLGDDNLHLMIWSEHAGEAERHRVEEIVYSTLQHYGGSISAEHGIGLEKKSYLHLSRSEAEIELMRKLKATLDPKGILNPGKLLPGTASDITSTRG